MLSTKLLSKRYLLKVLWWLVLLALVGYTLQPLSVNTVPSVTQLAPKSDIEKILAKRRTQWIALGGVVLVVTGVTLLRELPQEASMPSSSSSTSLPRSLIEPKISFQTPESRSALSTIPVNFTQGVDQKQPSGSEKYYLIGGNICLISLLVVLKRTLEGLEPVRLPTASLLRESSNEFLVPSPSAEPTQAAALVAPTTFTNLAHPETVTYSVLETPTSILNNGIETLFNFNYTSSVVPDLTKQLASSSAASRACDSVISRLTMSAAHLPLGLDLQAFNPSKIIKLSLQDTLDKTLIRARVESNRYSFEQLSLEGRKSAIHRLVTVVRTDLARQFLDGRSIYRVSLNRASMLTLEELNDLHLHTEFNQSIKKRIIVDRSASGRVEIPLQLFKNTDVKFNGSEPSCEYGNMNVEDAFHIKDFHELLDYCEGRIRFLDRFSQEVLVQHLAFLGQLKNLVMIHMESNSGVIRPKIFLEHQTLGLALEPIASSGARERFIRVTGTTIFNQTQSYLLRQKDRIGFNGVTKVDSTTYDRKAHQTFKLLKSLVVSNIKALLRELYLDVSVPVLAQDVEQWLGKDFVQIN